MNAVTTHLLLVRVGTGMSGPQNSGPDTPMQIFVIFREKTSIAQPAMCMRMPIYVDTSHHVLIRLTPLLPSRIVRSRVRADARTMLR